MAFRIGSVIEWSPPTLSGATPAATTPAMKASMSSWQLSSENRERIGMSPTSANLASPSGAHPQHVFVGADAFDGPQSARPEARAGAVGDPEVHRHADQREIQPAEIGLGRRIGPIGRVEQGGDVGERPFAPVAVELLFGDGAKMRIVHLAAGGVAIALAQALQLGVVDHFRLRVQAA